MKFNVSVPGIPKRREDHLRGVLVSILDVTDQILDRKRKTSYLVHFLEERLTKNERKELSSFLKKLISSLQVTSRPKEVQISGSFSGEQKYFHRFSTFGRISNPATDSHQSPEAGEILPSSGRGAVFHALIKEREDNESTE
jgi:predicted glycosyltransferase